MYPCIPSNAPPICLAVALTAMRPCCVTPPRATPSCSAGRTIGAPCSDGSGALPGHPRRTGSAPPPSSRPLKRVGTAPSAHELAGVPGLRVPARWERWLRAATRLARRLAARSPRRGGAGDRHLRRGAGRARSASAGSTARSGVDDDVLAAALHAPRPAQQVVADQPRQGAGADRRRSDAARRAWPRSRRRQRDGRWDAGLRAQTTATVPEDLQRALDANPAAGRVLRHPDRRRAATPSCTACTTSGHRQGAASGAIAVLHRAARRRADAPPELPARHPG